MSALPGYDDLPTVDGLGLPHSWDVFGRGDAFGTLNLLTPDVVAAALRGATTGVVVPLSLPTDQPDPPLFGRDRYVHSVFPTDRNTWDDRIDGYFPQSSSQWDAFRHLRAREHGFYGGWTGDPSEEPGRLGIDHWAARGIVGRGVLLDVESHLSARGVDLACDREYAIPADLLVEVAEAQRTELRPGDVLAVRTGWPSRYARLPLERRVQLQTEPAFPGLHAGEPTARLLWNWHVAAVVSDCPAIEPAPGDRRIGSLHRRLLPLLGIPLGELFDLDGLAAHCHAVGTYTFLFTAAPLHVPGGVGSPGNALAVF